MKKPALVRSWFKRFVYLSVGLLPPVMLYRLYASIYKTDCDIQSRKRHMIITPPCVRLATREEQLQKILNKPEEIYDVIVIGGGATGSGVALDAAVRGLKTLLLEAEDFASGTSSKSTKLIHGGVRYLELAFRNLDFRQLFLVKEALDERENLMYIGPHLSSVVPILLPIYRWLDIPIYYVGLKLYDLLASSKVVQSTEFVGRSKTLSLLPILEPSGLKGGVIYYDGMHNDARMNVSIALTAAHHGAVVLNHVRAESLLVELPSERSSSQNCTRIVGVSAKDQCSQKSLRILGKVVVNATGASYENILNLPQLPVNPCGEKTAQLNSPLITGIPRAPYQVAPSKGTHISIAASYSSTGLGVLNKTADGRVIFLLPWEGYTIAGTTDEPCQLDGNLSPSAKEVQFILKEISSFLNHQLEFKATDVKSAWSGIRPLLIPSNAENQSTKDIVRSHVVFRDNRGGLITVTGGKWTTYRQMAEDAVDAAIQEGKLAAAGPCRTKKLMLLGGHDYTDFIPIQLTQKHGVSFPIARHLAHSYGDRAFEVAELAATSGFRLLVPNSQFPFLEAEIEYAVHEYACTAADVICRRTRLAFLDYNAAIEILPRVIDLLAKKMNWDENKKQREENTTRKLLDRDFRPPTQQELQNS